MSKIGRCTAGCICLVLFLVGFAGMFYTIPKNTSTDHALNKYAKHEERICETLPPKQQKKIDHNKALIQTHKVSNVNEVAKLDQTNRNLRSDINDEKDSTPSRTNPYPMLSGSHWDMSDFQDDLYEENEQAYLVKMTNIILTFVFLAFGLAFLTF